MKSFNLHAYYLHRRKTAQFGNEIQEADAGDRSADFLWDSPTNLFDYCSNDDLTRVDKPHVKQLQEELVNDGAMPTSVNSTPRVLSRCPSPNIMHTTNGKAQESEMMPVPSYAQQEPDPTAWLDNFAEFSAWINESFEGATGPSAEDISMDQFMVFSQPQRSLDKVDLQY